MYSLGGFDVEEVNQLFRSFVVEGKICCGGHDFLEKKGVSVSLDVKEEGKKLIKAGKVGVVFDISDA